MRNREKLSSLVISIISQDDDGEMRAVELFNKIKLENPKMLRSERVPDIRSFSKVIAAFPELDKIGPHHSFRKYALKKINA